MSYSKVNQDVSAGPGRPPANNQTSLIDQDDLIDHDRGGASAAIGAQPFQIEPDVAADVTAAAATTAAAPQPRVIKPQVPAPNAHMFQIKFYRQFFDIDTDGFVHKLQRALNPFDTTFLGDGDAATELYGFIWITGTLIFLMFVSATGSNILASWIHGADNGRYEYKFDLLRLLVSLFYGYNLCVPLALYALTSWGLKFPRRLAFTELISIYGYTNILWVPITVVNFLIAVLVSGKRHSVLLNALEWTIVLLSGLVTGASNLMKVSPLIRQNCLILQEGNPDVHGARYHVALMTALGACHLVFTVVVKMCFFGL